MPKNILPQPSLFDNSDNTPQDDRPLPLIVADKWGFPLQHHIANDEYLYAVQDWFRGLLGRDNVSADISKANQLLGLGKELIKLPYTVKNGKVYQVDFCTDYTLYRFALNMRALKSNPNVKSIQDYLANAGVLVDSYRLNPEQALADHLPRLDTHTPQKLQTAPRSDERIKGIIQRNEFTTALKEAVMNADAFLYAQSTEKLYAGLWKRTSAQLRKELDVKPKQSLRDYFGEMALTYTRIAEYVATERLKSAETLTQETAMEIVYECAKLIHPQAMATAQALGVDLVTGKPLLNSTN